MVATRAKTGRFLYPLPRQWIIDILQGRLLVFATLNVGRIAEALEEAGFKTAQASGKTYIRIFTEVETDRGRLVVEVPALNENITQMVMEGRSIEHIVLAVRSVSEGLQEQLAEKFRDEVSDSMPP